MLVNSVTTKPAPSSLQINLNAGSLTPAMGARKTLLVNPGSLGSLFIKLVKNQHFKKVNKKNKKILSPFSSGFGGFLFAAAFPAAGHFSSGYISALVDKVQIAGNFFHV